MHLIIQLGYQGGRGFQKLRALVAREIGASSRDNVGFGEMHLLTRRDCFALHKCSSSFLRACSQLEKEFVEDLSGPPT